MTVKRYSCLAILHVIRQDKIKNVEKNVKYWKLYFTSQTLSSNYCVSYIQTVIYG